MPGFIEVNDETNEVRRHKIDSVGNNLSATLRWCAIHTQPVWVHDDGSFTCPWEHVTGHYQHMKGWGCGPEFHEIVHAPWSRPRPTEDET